ncbi:MAG TPA: lysophospholipid acyltransferase family protein [Bacteroidia bacterium]|nr:lysophospholipid acyltransferase family protein [Bacteroidia bacterium]
MQFLFRVFKTLYGIYGLLFFIASFAIIVPCYFFVFTFLPKKQAPFLGHKISRFWSKFVYFFIMIRVKISGMEKINPSETYVLIGNHQSQLDVPIYALACKNTVRFLAKAELTKVPLFGYIIKKLYVTVNREDKNDRYKSIETMKHTLNEKISIFLCPEGSRNRTSEPLLDFKDGAFRLAIDAQIPLAVLTIIDSKKHHSPLRPLELLPGTIKAVWETPIETKGMTQDDVPKLKEMARQLMIKNLSKN